MDRNPFKLFVLAVFLFFAALLDPSVSFAQDDSSSNNGEYNLADDKAAQQSSEQQTQQTLDQIHDLVLKMQENAKRLDALEKAVDKADTQAAPDDESNNANNVGQEVTEATAPTQELSNQTAPIQEPTVQEAPVEQAPANTAPQTAPVKGSPIGKPNTGIKAEPVNVFPLPAVYFSSADSSQVKVHTFEISPDDFYMEYKVPGMRLRGEFYGLNTSYTYRPLEAEYSPINVFHMDVSGDFGKTNYNFGDEGSFKDINNYIVEPRAWIGKDLDLGSLAIVTPYLGIGYRYDFSQVKNKFSDAEDDYIGVDGYNQYLYIPVGVQLSTHLAEGWRLDTNAEYDYLAWGSSTNDSADFDYDSHNFYYTKIDNTLRHGYGLRGSLKIVKEMDTVNFFVEPYIRYWDIGKSSAATQYRYVDGNLYAYGSLEQYKNQTTEIGARLGVEF